jgi:hypothetical protein
MASNRLTDVAIKRTIQSVLRAGKRSKKADGEGLYLLIEPRRRAAFWRQRYRFGGIEKVLAHGVYPEVSLRRAREKRAEARLLLERGIDPGAHRKAKQQAAKISKDDTFASVAQEWFAHYRPNGNSPTNRSHPRQSRRRNGCCISPSIGKKRIRVRCLIPCEDKCPSDPHSGKLRRKTSSFDSD